MSKPNDKLEESDPPDIIKIQPDKNLEEFLRRNFIEGTMEAGQTREEAEAGYRRFQELLADPNVREGFSKALELSETYGLEATFRAIERAADYLEERDKPRPALRVWTEAEDDRRAKPRGGKGTPDLP